jgi:biopolymer transport protein ExbD
MSRRKSFLKRRAPHEEMSLQITSMADIFMILLVFMLKSLSSGTIEIAPSKGLQLPISQSDDHSTEALKVEISETSVLIDGHQAAPIANFRFNPSSTDQTGVAQTLVSAFEQERSKQKPVEGKDADARIIVVADQRAPYRTIKTVLASAAAEGYTDVKLAVVHEN